MMPLEVVWFQRVKMLISVKSILFFFTLLTAWSRVLLEKLTGSQVVKKFPTYYGNQSFFTAFTNAYHLFLS